MNEPATNLDSSYITPQRLMWILDIGATTELELRRRKQISFFKCGRNVRYSPAAVLEFIARYTVRARSGTSLGARGTASLPDEAWARIERLIADQVEAAINRRGATDAERKAA